MTDEEKKIAEKICPEKMDRQTLEEKIEAAKAWLGSDYLLAVPINRKRAA